LKVGVSTSFAHIQTPLVRPSYQQTQPMRRVRTVGAERAEQAASTARKREAVINCWRSDGALTVVFAPDRDGPMIADVAGKGLPAALIMSSLQAAFRAFW
jgi:serine phosphatase RsbU (regulator of sigma subunit)